MPFKREVAENAGVVLAPAVRLASSCRARICRFSTEQLSVSEEEPAVHQLAHRRVTRAGCALPTVCYAIGGASSPSSSRTRSANAAG